MIWVVNWLMRLQYSRLSEVQAAEDTRTAIEESKIVKVLTFFTVFYLPTAILGVSKGSISSFQSSKAHTNAEFFLFLFRRGTRCG